MKNLLEPIAIRAYVSMLLMAWGGVLHLACGALHNNIDRRNLSCGIIEDDQQNFSWFQIQNDRAEILDLNMTTFSLVDSDLELLPKSAYRLSSKGCLGIDQKQEFTLRIPGRKILFTGLEPSELPFQLVSVQSLDSPLKVNLEPTRSVYRSKSQVRVSRSEKSKLRYCLEDVNQTRCIKSSDLNAMISSQEFLKITDSLELPSAEGRYRLHILSEARDGSLMLNPFDFSIDNTAPRVIPDFTERVGAITYFGHPNYFIEPGYPIKFLSFNDSLAGIRIEYCLVPQNSQLPECPNPQIYGIENSPLVPPGASKLVYRAVDVAGNFSSEHWQSISIMSQASCRASDFLQSILSANPLSCHILEGDLDLNLIAPKSFPLLDQLIEVKGRIELRSETTTSVPLFQNLNAAIAIDFSLGAELDTDFISFPQLRRLRELHLRLSMGGKSIEAFNEITQLSRGRLMNLENVKDLRILRKMQAVDDEFWLAAIGTMKNLDFLNELRRVGNLRITHNDELYDIKGLKNLASVARLEIAYNPKLASLNGLGSLIWVEKMELSGLAIVDFEGLSKLKEVTETLLVRSNPQLVSVKGLDSLTRVSYFLFRDNERLPAGTQLLGQTIEQ